MSNSFGLPDRYKIIAELGSGGMGSVYKAHDSNLDKIVAIKLLRNKVIADDSTVLRRFQKEAQAAGKLKNDNLITTLDFGIAAEGVSYLVMEYAEGTTVKDLVKKGGILQFDNAIDLFVQMASGMAHAHEQNVIHRDLKSENVVVTKTEDGADQVKIIDFGIAHILDQEKAAKLTRTNAIVGSPLYMSPEQVKGSGGQKSSDIYSLGCVFFECLTGAPPFKGDSAMETMNMHLSEDAPKLNEMAGENHYAKSVEDLISRMLEKAPEDRPASMTTVLHELKRIKVAKDRDDTTDTGTTTSTTDISTAKPFWNKRKLQVCIASTLVSFIVFCLFLLCNGKGAEIQNRFLAEVGSSSHQYLVGKKFLHKSNYKESFYWLGKAAENNNIDAQLLLARVYRDGLGTKKDSNAAFNMIKRAAQNGSREAELYLARIYLAGKVVCLQPSEESAWWKYRAESNAQSFQQTREAVNVEDVIGINYPKAVKWLRKAAKQGSVEARADLAYCYAMGQGVKKDFHKAVSLNMEASIAGNALAQCNLGHLYYKGFGVKKNHQKAYKWFNKSAKQNNSEALYMVFTMHSSGEIYKNNAATIKEFLIKSGELGFSYAQYTLGCYYLTGKLPFERNYEKAFYWLKKSAEQNNIDALNKLGLMYSSGHGVKVNGPKSFKYYEKAAILGSRMGMLNLANSYRYEIGVKRDLKKASFWEARSKLRPQIRKNVFSE